MKKLLLSLAPLAVVVGSAAAIVSCSKPAPTPESKPTTMEKIDQKYFNAEQFKDPKVQVTKQGVDGFPGKAELKLIPPVTEQAKKADGYIEIKPEKAGKIEYTISAKKVNNGTEGTLEVIETKTIDIKMVEVKLADVKSGVEKHLGSNTYDSIEKVTEKLNETKGGTGDDKNEFKLKITGVKSGTFKVEEVKTPAAKNDKAKDTNVKISFELEIGYLMDSKDSKPNPTNFEMKVKIKDTSSATPPATPHLDALKAEIKIAKAIEIGDKTQDAFTTLQAAITAAEAVTEEEKAEAALTTLKAAVEAFNNSEPATPPATPHLDALKAEIKIAKAIEIGDKTQDAFTTLQAAITAAEAVTEEEKAEAALTTLQAAVEAFNNSEPA